MKKCVFAKLLFGSLVVMLGILLGSFNVEAASFESMKENIEVGEGYVYNPLSDSVMTQESSLQFIQFIEEEKTNLESEIVPDDVIENAFKATESLETLKKEHNMDLPLIQQRGASVPTNIVYLDNMTYTSNPFSARGWRFSETKFTFRDINKNPFFAIKATKDSFYFKTETYQFEIPANGGYIYYHATSPSYANPNIRYRETGYFATYNPVSGSRYYIY